MLPLANEPLLRSAETSAAFYMNSWLGAERITDGLSNTAFVSELRIPLNAPDIRGSMHYPEGQLYQHNYTPNSMVADWLRSGSCNNKADTPCMAPSGYTGAGNRRLIMTARSYHPGGVNLLGDGSTHCIQTID